jgi:nicotinamidase-related amidase
MTCVRVRCRPALAAAALLIAAPTPMREAAAQDAKAGEVLRLNLRSRVEMFKGTGEFREAILPTDLPAKETAAVICDMWDDHWCKAAARRCDELANKMAPVVEALRARGVRIIHAPSDCMDFYKDAPQRKAMIGIKKIPFPEPRIIPDCPLPIDDAKGGCDDEMPVKPFRAWKRQHPAIRIADDDVISDKGDEVYSFLAGNGIKNLIVMGVHTNMCILRRPFTIKRMTGLGLRCVLVRDLTDAMYDPRARPFVSHEKGTELVIEYIERTWCPTVLSKELK